MQVADLNAQYGLEGVLRFDTHGELPRAQVTLPGLAASVYVQGAHLATLHVAGTPATAELRPLLYLSQTSRFSAGKAIRGGVPVSFPWFATDTENRAGGKPGPSHGFARTEDWTLAFVNFEPATTTLRLTWTLAPGEASRGFGYDGFRLVYEMLFAAPAPAGHTLPWTPCELRLGVLNAGTTPLVFESALHTYFAVDDVRTLSVAGLEEAPFLDKTAAGALRYAPPTPFALTDETDRVYPGSSADVTIRQPGRMPLTVEKQGSATTVVWNPWEHTASAMADLDGWIGFVCVETANTGADRITLAPGATHGMRARFTLGEAAQ